MMQWDKLLSEQRRFHPSPGPRPQQLRSAFEQDADRIQFSPDFRRLQDKTQVYPSPDNDSAHSRLTHSLEVASVARSLARTVGTKLWGQSNLKAVALEQAVLAASLLHDIGNPPFGHAGELIIREYFLRARGLAISPELLADLTHFDGNAQGLRVVMTVSNAADGGLHLTDAVLAASVKYPWRATKERKKCGVFAGEAERYAQVAHGLGLAESADPAGPWDRHPAAWVVEAADDVCNSILDAEDAFRLGLLTTTSSPGREVFEGLEVLARLSPRFRQERYNTLPVSARNERLGYIRSLVIGVGVEECTTAFCDSKQSMLNGKPVSPLLEQSQYWNDFRRLKSLVYKHCFALDEVVLRELAGEHALRVLLETFVPAAAAPVGSTLSQREKLARRYLGRCIGLGDEDHPDRNVRRVVDFIAGMTDRYALRLAREVCGESLLKDNIG